MSRFDGVLCIILAALVVCVCIGATVAHNKGRSTIGHAWAVLYFVALAGLCELLMRVQ